MDPFETFGRDLNEYHANIRHVPYVPKYGMVDVHKELLSQAGGIIVLMCIPPSMKGYLAERLDGSKYQKRFAKEVGRYVRKLPVPTVLVTIGMTGVEESERFGGTLELDDWDDLEDAADRICGGEDT